MKSLWISNVKILTFLWIGLHLCVQVTSFKCYACISNENRLCFDASQLESTVDCEGYCTIVRTEYTDIPGTAISLIRACEKEPLVPDGVRTDKHYTKMYSSCDFDLCNDGDGSRDPSEGDNGGGPSDVIIVPESSSGFTKPFGLLVITMLFVKFAVTNA